MGAGFLSSAHQHHRPDGLCTERKSEGRAALMGWTRPQGCVGQGHVHRAVWDRTEGLPLNNPPPPPVQTHLDFDEPRSCRRQFVPRSFSAQKDSHSVLHACVLHACVLHASVVEDMMWNMENTNAASRSQIVPGPTSCLLIYETRDTNASQIRHRGGLSLSDFQ